MREAALTRPWRSRSAQRRITRTCSAGAGPADGVAATVGAGVGATGAVLRCTPGVLILPRSPPPQPAIAAITMARVGHNTARATVTPSTRSWRRSPIRAQGEDAPRFIVESSHDVETGLRRRARRIRMWTRAPRVGVGGGRHADGCGAAGATTDTVEVSEWVRRRGRADGP